MKRTNDFLCFCYFLNYILLIILLQLSHFFPLSPSTQHPQSLWQSPHHCSCPWVKCISSLATSFPILYFTSPWLFCNYFTASPIPPFPPSSGNHQNALCVHDTVSVLVCLVFLDSIVDRYVFIAILLLLIFFS